MKTGMDFRSKVKTGAKIDMFWSEIVLGFGKSGSIPTSRRVTPGRGALFFFASTKEESAYSLDNPYISILGELRVVNRVFEMIPFLSVVSPWKDRLIEAISRQKSKRERNIQTFVRSEAPNNNTGLRRLMFLVHHFFV